MARTVYVICTRDAYWPPEAFVVFGTLAAAETHLERSVWAFRIEPLPVYSSYEECPIANRELDTAGTELMRQSVQRQLRDRAAVTSGSGPDMRPAPPWGAVEGTVYAVCAHDSDPDIYVEVQLFYETDHAAREHVSNSAYMASVLAFDVFPDYEKCPPAKRFIDRRGLTPLSQAMEFKRP